MEQFTRKGTALEKCLQAQAPSCSYGDIYMGPLGHIQTELLHTGGNSGVVLRERPEEPRGVMKC